MRRSPTRSQSRVGWMRRAGHPPRQHLLEDVESVLSRRAVRAHHRPAHRHPGRTTTIVPLTPMEVGGPSGRLPVAGDRRAELLGRLEHALRRPRADAAEAGGLPVASSPTRGTAERVGERLIYISSPQYMAEYAARMIAAGARMGAAVADEWPSTSARCAEVVDRHARVRAPRGWPSRGGRGSEARPVPSLPTTARPPCSSAVKAGSSWSRSSLTRRAATTSRSSCRARSSLKERGARSGHQ